ncbi:MAG: MFS transporter [Armatimonadetes bacterium]|nr:MFS transporter [Armatimonadota bacterium]
MDNEGSRKAPRDAGWQRTLYASVAAQFLVSAGIGFVFPFLPFFIKTLGVQSEQEVRRWTGYIFAANGITMCIFAPIWGAVGDRYGRKLMVLRSMLAIGVFIVLMGFVRKPWQLFALRMAQGTLSGTISANMAMVSSTVPTARLGFAMGLIYVAADAGRVLGPTVGGVLADTVGFRVTFWLAGALPLAGALLIGLLALEPPLPSKEAAAGVAATGATFLKLLTISGVAAVMLVLFQTSFAGSIAQPLMPLYVAGLRGTEERAASVTGGIISGQAIAALLATGYLGKMSDRWGHRRMLLVGTSAAAFLLSLHAFARNLVDLTVLRTLMGFTSAAIMPSSSALIRRLAPPESIGKAFGLSQSVRSMGHVLGPLTGGFISARVAGMMGLRVPFLLAGTMMGLAAAVLAWQVRAARSARAAEAERATADTIKGRA